MTRQVRIFTFEPDVSMESVEESVLLSVLAAEGLHGAGQVRLDAAYHVNPRKRACVIDVGSDVGRDVARVLTGFLIREFGEDSFDVRRPNRQPQLQTA